MNIRQFKMINGDDILALVESKNTDNYKVEMPVLVEANGDGNFRFTPWFMLSSEKVYTLEKRTIVNQAEVDEDIKYSYVQYVSALNEDTTLEVDYINEYETDIDDNENSDTTCYDRKIVH